jgi:hypothetical protein
MRAGFTAHLVLALIAGLPAALTAQQPPPMPRGPASLSVPHPIPPVPTTPPPDLYHQLTPPPSPPTGVIPSVVYGFYGPYAPWGYMGSGYTNTWPVPVDHPAQFASIPQGTLWFESSPRDAQVYVDGAYVGVISDFGIYGRALVLDQGLHRVDLRAPGYAPVSFDIQIVANQTTRYRGDLQPIGPPVPTPASAPGPPAPRKPTYMIPNCYAGDRPPTRALPRGCDLSKMVVKK